MRYRIRRGIWKAGSTLPSIDRMMAEFGVGRITVRQAIRLLADENLLSSERGKGTFVHAETGANRRLSVSTSLHDLVEMYRGDRPELDQLIEDDAAPVLREADGVAAPDYVHMQRVHSRDGERYCVVSLYIDRRVFDLAPERFRTELVIPLFADMPEIRVTRARQSLNINSADIEIAHHLQIPINSPVAEIRRIFNGPDDEVIYLGEATYRGDYIHLEMDLGPSLRAGERG